VVATVLFLALHNLTVVVRKKFGWMAKDTEAAAQAQVQG
jgi:hypothetical protein